MFLITNDLFQIRNESEFTFVDFEANVSVRCSTPKLQAVVDEAQMNLNADISVDTVGQYACLFCHSFISFLL